MHKQDGFEAVAAAPRQQSRDLPSLSLLLVFHAAILASTLLHGPIFFDYEGRKGERNPKKKKKLPKNREAINHSPPADLP